MLSVRDGRRLDKACQHSAKEICVFLNKEIGISSIAMKMYNTYNQSMRLACELNSGSDGCCKAHLYCK